jgi:hypothetical protein
MRRVLSVLLAVWTAACYTYTPTQVSAQPAPREQLRVELTMTGTDSLARVLGPGVKTVDGRLIQATPESIELGVTQVTMYSGLEQYWKGESVVIPKQYVQGLDTRTFSLGKTGLLAGVILAMLLALGAGTGFGGLQGNGGSKGPQ